jgi:hypothetical protein
MLREKLAFIVWISALIIMSEIHRPFLSFIQYCLALGWFFDMYPIGTIQILCSVNYEKFSVILLICLYLHLKVIAIIRFRLHRQLEDTCLLIINYLMLEEQWVLVHLSNPMAYFLLRDRNVVGVMLFILWSFTCPNYRQVIVSLCMLYERVTSKVVNCNYPFLHIFKLYGVYFVAAPMTFGECIRLMVLKECPDYIWRRLPNAYTNVFMELFYLPHTLQPNLNVKVTLFEQKCQDLVIGAMSRCRVDTQANDQFFTANDLQNWFKSLSITSWQPLTMPPSITIPQIYNILKHEETEHDEPFEKYLKKLFQKQNSYSTEELLPCLICQDGPREVVNLPCRHLVSCQSCAIMADTTECMLCKQLIYQTIQIYSS